MAATRKLQGEIDRCLKKVTEGVETFEDIWQKVHNANNSNPKVLEKYESDLKKEIKKLQRLRDQIKSWIASGEIKDKSALLENRRLIETQMERFKVVERETKTKAYSKEGLGAAQKLDPAQRVKDEIRSWLTSSISSLQIQIDQYESEIESLLAGKKKRLDRDKQDRMDELRSKLDRHKFHVTKLETLLRLLDNDSVEADQIRKIKDDVEYYIESSQEPDFEENEFLYDDIIGLDEVELSGTGVPSSATTDSNNSNETAGSPSNSIMSGSSPVQSPIQLNCSSSTTTTNNNVNNVNNLNCSSDSTSVDITAADKRNKNETNASTKVKPVVKPTAVRAKDANSNTATTTSHTSTNSTVSSVLSQQQQPLQPSNKVIMSSTPSKPTAPSLTSTSSVSSASTNVATNNSAVAIPPATPFAAVAKNLFIPSDSVASHASTSNAITSSTTSAQSRTSPITTATRASPGILSPKHMNGPLMQQQQQQQQQTPQIQQPQQDASTLKTIAQEAINRSNNSNESIIPVPSSVSAGVIPRVVQQQQPPSQQTQQSQPQHFSSTPSSVAIAPTDSTVTIASSVTTNGPILSTGDQSSLSSSLKQPQTQQQQQPATNEAHIPPLLGVAPLGPQPLQKEQQYQFQMMEASSHHLPQLSDSERLGTYYHRHPVQTPPHYPQTQPAHYDVVEFFQRLNTDTLFFVFYYMEGTKAQYLAAKALKKQSWRFHTKYYMWFQRHEEPKIINDDYEQGTYIYFDYEKWAQRKKEGFTFEYKYLEDKDLN